MTRDWYSLLSFLVLFSLGYVSRDSFGKFIINLIATFIYFLKLFIMSFQRTSMEIEMVVLSKKKKKLVFLSIALLRGCPIPILL
jgi:hypothetical protein